MSRETNAHHSTGPVELWKYWNETTARMWASTLESGMNSYSYSFGLYNFWMKPAGFFKQWNDSSEMWTRMLGEMMSSEQWLEVNYHYIDVFINMVKDTSYLVNAMMFPNSRIPTRPDIAQVAKLVVSLEERIYAIEDALVNVEDGELKKVVPGQVVEERVGPLECVEGKQDTSSIQQQTEVIGDLAERLKRVEGKLDRLLAAWEKLEARAYPESA